MKRTIAVIYGGEGLESDISVESAQNLISALDKRLYTPLPIFIDKSGVWKIVEPGSVKNELCDTPETYPVRLDGESGFFTFGKIIPVEIAIVAMHGNFGEDGIIQGALRCAGIPALSQSVLACALTNDKAACKAVADSIGIKNADWILLTESGGEQALKIVKEKFTYPIFLKACSFGSSFGAYRIECDGEFLSRYAEIRAHGESRIIAEEYIESDYELECAYIDCKGEHYLPFGIVHSEGRFYSFDEKYKSDSSFAPALGKIPEKTARTAVEYSRALRRATGIKYLARFDYFIKGEDVIFNEINAFPGMTKTSLYPRMINERLCPFTECLTRLISYACGYDRNI